ncbi:ABC transporter substrate-binding protein [Albimonas pacifica]|uniref:ABC transporter, substrate binding protein, PQQ-dependent alcohol dehydrogenase system n=1 Tax=Albimonas pacifica TaxID=1114924 RepID=A0A1I3IGR6_9RHOB|nr:ABC transporter substrate-binding protein [Albimonas pacifica]SFI47112.1 ABC transporter, substrate binding protein, PQQ-dependent alcohol dehydrogenase system [Albimonas pacifica]
MLRPLALLASLALAVPASAELAVRVAWLEQSVEQPPILSNLDPVPGDLGLAGARLGLADDAKTGRFLGHAYALDAHVVPPGGDFLAAARAALAQTPLLVAKAPAETLLALADLPEAQGALILNASAQDDALRGEACRANLLHAIPSYAMRADALSQFLTVRRWTDVALVEGTHPGDRAFAAALRRSFHKFGLRVRADETWEWNADIRRDAGRETPLFTQGFAAHDVMVVADEAGDFARYMMFNTWRPAIMAGSEGLSPIAWSPALEQWGAAQLQSRFEALAGRDMRAEDYAAWAAVRALGEAATRTGAADADALRAYLLSDAFELAGFKGRPMTFRPWNGQLRQPMPLVHPRALVALTPLEGFLHPRSDLDTLGQDEGESGCRAFARD